MAATRNSRRTDLPESVAACLAPRLSRGDRVCVALSGGRDSVALLHALIALCAPRAGRLPDLSLSAVHVHHGLSAHADAWADFCATLCAAHDIAFRCVRVAVDRDDPAGLEAAARRARYAVFADCDADWLLLAHHRDDQAETLLLNLLRGAGVRGLAAMPEERPLSGGVRLLRPLLQVSRRQIEGWLAERGHDWVDDESNADSELRRNFLRREVLPLIGRQFSEPSAALARAAGHLAEMAALADEVAENDAHGVIEDDTLLIAALNRLPPARRGNVLRRFLGGHGLRMPDARYLTEMLRQLSSASPSAAPLFRIDGADLSVSRNRLWATPPPPAGGAEIPWDGGLLVPWAGGRIAFSASVGQGLSQQALAAGSVVFRLRHGGEVLQPDLRRPRRKLKKLLQEAGLPQWQREHMPLLWCGDSLLWAAAIGYTTAPAFAAAPGEAGWLLTWENWQPAASARGSRHIPGTGG